MERRPVATSKSWELRVGLMACALMLAFPWGVKTLSAAGSRRAVTGERESVPPVTGDPAQAPGLPPAVTAPRDATQPLPGAEADYGNFKGNRAPPSAAVELEISAPRNDSQEVEIRHIERGGPFDQKDENGQPLHYRGEKIQIKDLPKADQAD